MENRLTWADDVTSDLSHTVDWRYVIVRTVLPERRPDRRHVYTLGKVDTATRPACRSLDDAMRKG
jgi:hypothetical protein